MTKRGASRIGPLLLCAATAGCVGAAPTTRPGPDYRGAIIGRLVSERAQPKLDLAGINAAIDSAAIQVKRCYRQPPLPSSSRTIATTLRVRLSQDGSLSDVPTLVGQSGVTDGNRAFAGRMAEAASLAIIRCAPLRLPAEFHDGGWDEIVLTFSPARLA